MSQTIDAVFDGRVLRPETELLLKPNTRVRLTLEVVPGTDAGGEAYSFLKLALAANLSGPSDWSSNLEQYLYGDDDRQRG
jgi:hypothetical protein